MLDVKTKIGLWGFPPRCPGAGAGGYRGTSKQTQRLDRQ